MKKLAFVLLLASAPVAADTGVVYTTTYEMTDSIVREIETLSGHWYSPGERLVPIRRDADGSVTVRTTWSGYRGRFAAQIVVDSVGRVREIRWMENDGRITRSKRRRVTELANV